MNPAKGNLKVIKNGRFLCIDPSSGSSGSHIGYAIFDQGKLDEAGIINMTDHWEQDVGPRLKGLSDCLREEFDEEFDLVVVEKIRPFKRGRAYHAHVSLIWAIGLIVGSLSYDKIIEIHPRTHMASTNHLFPMYYKDDMMDAISMGVCLIAFAHGYEPKKVHTSKYSDKLDEIKEIVNGSLDGIETESLCLF